MEAFEKKNGVLAAESRKDVHFIRLEPVGDARG